MLAKLKKFLASVWVRLFIGFILLEAVSFAVFPSIWLSRAAFVLVLLLAAYFSWRKTEYGVYILLSELFVGGFGYLLSFPLDSGRIPLRMGLFAVVMAIWLIKYLQKPDWTIWRDKRLIPLAIFFSIFAHAVLHGFMNGYALGAIVSDFNSYIHFALVGVFLSVKLDQKKLLQILFVAATIVSFKTLAVLYIFSHGLASVGPDLIYKWVRDTGVGEITLISAPLYRVFFQSHIFNLMALVISAHLLLADRIKTGKLLLWAFAYLNFFVIVISQSRSFWVAGLLALILLIPAAAKYSGISFSRLVPYLLVIPAFALLSNFAGQGIISDFGVDFFTGRVGGVAGEAGVSSRMAELKPAFSLIQQAPLLGSGFGTTVRFRSDDPRIKNTDNPEGWTDAVAIEWGYLDLAVKTGILGLLAYLAFLLSLAWSLWPGLLKRDPLSTCLLIGLLSLLAVHMFTPYLNHPLGIGSLLAIIALTNMKSKI